MHTTSLPKKHRCVSSLIPLPAEPDPELQKSEPTPTSPRPRCIPRLQLNMTSKSSSAGQNSTSPIEILSQPSVSNPLSSAATQLQPVTKLPTTVPNLYESLKLFKLPLQFISTLLTMLIDRQNTSSTVSPLINFQMPLSLSTIHPYDPLPDSTNNSPIAGSPSPDKTNNVHYTSYGPAVPACSSNNLPAPPCNSQPGTTNNLPSYNSLSDNTNNLPVIIPNYLPAAGNTQNALVYSLLYNILLDEIRRLTLDKPAPVNMPESASDDTLPASSTVTDDETLIGGNTPTDMTNDLLTSTSNNVPILPGLFKPSLKVSKSCPIHPLKSINVKSHHSPSTYSTPVINPYHHSRSKLYPSNYKSSENFKNVKSDGVSLNPQEELILKILSSLYPTHYTAPPQYQSK